MKRLTRTRLRRMVPLLWLLPCMFFIGVAAFHLRENNLEALRLRDVVLETDKENGDVERALQELRSFMGQHMNTGLANGPNAVHPPIQLKYTYDRLTQASAGGSNANIYNEAQTYCEKTGSQGFSGGSRLSCIEQYISTHGTGTGVAPSIPKNLYQFDFATPRWSPDAAGWSIVAATLCFLAIPSHYLVRYLRRNW